MPITEFEQNFQREVLTGLIISYLTHKTLWI